MRIDVAAYSQPNQALQSADFNDPSDVSSISLGGSTFADNLIEYAGRVCYKSTRNMGKAPGFQSARVREGHEDIIEHISVTLRMTPHQMSALKSSKDARYFEDDHNVHGRGLITANMRAWLNAVHSNLIPDEDAGLMVSLKGLAPRLFREIGDGSGLVHDIPPSPVANKSALLPCVNGKQAVTLLAYTQPDPFDDTESRTMHGSATFLLDGISRACTHQFVRHRLGSYSQESQRYVDLKKGGWSAVVPPAIQADEAAAVKMNEAWEYLQEKYFELRKMGIRKEDARFLLPNAAETRMVVTMPYSAWSHFVWLRAVDKAAQWEIREVGQAILKMLYAIAPDVFEEHWQVYQQMIENAR